MKSKIQNISHSIAIFSAVLGCVIIYTALGRSKFLYFFLAGLILILPLAILMVKQWLTSTKESNLINETIVYLKQNGHKVTIDLNQVKIYGNNWQEEIVTDYSRYAYLNNLTGNSERNVTRIDVSASTLLFTTNHKGEEIKFSVHTDLDETTTKMKLGIQKEATLYIDKENANQFYIDLDFLD